MGCGVSRPVLEHDDAPPPPGLRPIRRRIEEIKRNRKAHKRSQSHLSSKELLHDDDVDSRITDDEDCHARKSVSYRLESIREVDQAPAPAPPLVVVEEKKKKEVNLIESLGNVEVVVVNKQEEKKEEAAAAKVEEEEEHQHHHEGQEEEDEEEEEDEYGYGYGSDFGPASPSFREYCVFSADTNSVDSDDHEFGKDESSKSDAGKSDGEPEGGEKREERRRKNSIVSSEGSITVLVKKEHKGRKFKRVLPKGSQVAMKNLLNVKGCYIPPCSNPHNHNNHRLTSTTS